MKVKRYDIEPKANLRGANLSGANLSGADLPRADLHGAAIVIYGLEWPVFITRDHICIGCEQHKLQSWQGFSDNRIKRMEKNASAFWAAHRDMILSLCENLTSEFKEG